MSEPKFTPGPWHIGTPPPNGEQTIGTVAGLMIDSKTKEFGMKLANSPYWHWLPGMLLISEGGVVDRVVRVRKPDGWLYLASNDWGNSLDWYNPKGSYPDIFDPATLGCVISLLKFRMKEPTLHFTPDRDGWYLNKLSLDGPDRGLCPL